MADYRRYGLYVVPHGAFYRAGADWLGWDSVAGRAVAHPTVADLPGGAAAMTEKPRKYGFHGTLKPPFRLAEGTNETALRAATAALCRSQPPVTLPALTVRRLGGFVAVVPAAPSPALARLAAATVTGLDRFRAPLTDAEIARRRSSHLSDRQERMLRQWGYPHVLEEFRFHLTLTGNLGALADPVATLLADHFAPVLPAPLIIDSLCLMGEDDAGRFHLLDRYALSG